MSDSQDNIIRDKQYYKFCLYGFLKNLRFFEPFLIIFFLQKGFNLVHVGTLYAIREVSINLFEIPSGIIADAFGRRKTLAASFLLYIFSFILFYVAESYLILAFGMLLFALGDATRSGVNKAMIVKYLERTNQLKLKVDYYGHTRSWSQIGSALSSLIGGFLVFFTNQLNLIFIFSIIPSFLDLINVLSYPKFLDSINDQQDYRQRLNSTFIGFVKSIKNKSTQIALINVSIYSGFYKSVKDFIQPYIKVILISLPILTTYNENEKSSIILGLLYFIIFIFNSYSSRYASKLIKLFNSSHNFLNKSLIIGGTMGIITGFFMFVELLYLPIIIFILLLGIENIRKPAGVDVLTEKSINNTHSGVLSVASQFASVFTSVFVILLGFLSEYFGVGIGIALLSFIIIIFSLIGKVK